MPHFEAERRILEMQLRQHLKEIQGTVFTQRQPIAKLEYKVTGADKGPERAPKSGWQPFEVHGRWGGFDQTTWFRFRVKIPAAMKGKRVVALVRPGGESLAYVNGKPVQGLDRNRDMIVLTEDAKPGTVYEIAMESVCSTRFDEFCTFDYAGLAVMHSLPWDFFWDATTALDVYAQLPADYAPAHKLLDLVNAAMKTVDLQSLGERAYDASLEKARRLLRRGLADLAPGAGQGQLTLAGHAHIDTAWLWPLRETQRKCGRTFSTVLNYMKRYPEYHFTCSQPVQYEWIKKHYPELYEQIRVRVKEGRWEACGAMYVEPDLNMPSGESLVRQCLYGKRFFRAEFGVDPKVAWTPDTFGYSAALPQILKKAGVDTFITMKLRWGNQYTQFPYHLFEWEGLDGSRVTAMMPDDYNGNPTPEKLIGQWKGFAQKEKTDHWLFPFGYGDGGGGPTLDMLEQGKRLGAMVGVPRAKFGTVQQSVDKIKRSTRKTTLPVWVGELFFELHRGCQTSQALTKRNNRKSEFLLRQTELISSLALLNGIAYDSARIEEAWKTVLKNQFHDILPGSSIHEVYVTAAAEYAAAQAMARSVRDTALTALARKIDTSGPGSAVLVVNDLSWVRHDIVRVEMALPPEPFTVVNAAGRTVPHQVVGAGALVFEALNLPPLGYAVYHLVPGTAGQAKPLLKATNKGMENEFIRIAWDKKGRLTTVHDKSANREVLAPGQPGNVLQLFDDRPGHWEAWDIDFNFEEKMWEPAAPESIKVIETGPVRAVVRIVRKTKKSTITQDLTLHAHSPRLDFVTTVDWHERRTLLKAAFPVAVRSAHAAFDVQYGVVERPTHANREHDAAQFEVPAHKWADLSEGNYGVSLLNDCKYGYDVKGNILRLSLLRSPADPDPSADEGLHHFTYSLLPHLGDWRWSTVRQGFELNTPPHAVSVASSKGGLPGVDAFATTDQENVIVDAIKRHEDSDAIIVRVYETYGQRAETRLTFGRKPKEATECDLIEENDRATKLNGARLGFTLLPYEVRTFKLKF
ncbi:MAG: alpha-mannosidase [Candidatus Hydrogenedentes bacterium]|nr:alpha-mannosidase [Candidatus Hydrogenedentota bacterium]